MTTPQQLIIRRPDDWHVHLRDGAMLKTVVPFTSAVNGRAIIMPNLVPPLTATDAAIAYRNRILAAIPDGHDFTPLMTCYLTDSLSTSDLEYGFRAGVFTAAKLYPAHATTNSHYGVTRIAAISNVLERMQETGMPLLIHGEVTGAHIDIFDREARFIDTVLEPLRQQFPALKVVFEHITTQEAVQYVRDGNALIAATITPQHLMFNRNHMLTGGIRPHLYCLPVLKRNIHQQALCDIVASGHPRFFLGSDSAPHLRSLKEAGCGCAGIFNAPVSLPACAAVFEQLNALAHFEAFCAENGAKFYGLPLNTGTVTLVRQPWRVTQAVAMGEDTLIPFLAGEMLNWQVKSAE